MSNLIYLLLAIAAMLVGIWQIGLPFGAPNAAAQPDLMIALSALTAAVIFFGLWLASRFRRDESKSRVKFD